jgi:predicted regulator of Ras-like GTPase activity (Roadblock/LC7/MglB family)
MTGDPIAALGPDDIREIQALLHAFVREAGARCALLVDRNGRAITSAGDTAGVDETSFASLAAADFDASDQLASLLGESEFTALYHQGVSGSMYLSDVKGVAILGAVFDQRTTLGMVRLKTREVVPGLQAVLAAMESREPDQSSLETGFGEDAAGEIDRLLTG